MIVAVITAVFAVALIVVGGVLPRIVNARVGVATTSTDLGRQLRSGGFVRGIRIFLVVVGAFGLAFAGAVIYIGYTAI